MTAEGAGQQLTRNGHSWGLTIGEAVGPISFGDGVADFTIKVGHQLQADDLIL